MKFASAFLFMISGHLAMAQDFTYGSVYNYSVGDTIVTSYNTFNPSSGTSGISKFTYRVFTGKSYSPAKDTVFYTTYEVDNTPCFNCPAVITETVTGFYVTNLTDSVVCSFIGGCSGITDTAFQGYCQFQTRILYCKGKPYNQITLIEGIGYFEQYYSNQAGYGIVTKFIKAHKVGKNCDIVGSIPNSLSENDKLKKVQVFPNPSGGDFSIRSSMGVEAVLIDLNGREIQNMTLPAGLQQVKFNQPTGVYQLKLVTEGSVLYKKVVILRQ